jgi:alanine-alpha-ketoisovalerate/valine-pyruvate aminotransferase
MPHRHECIRVSYAMDQATVDEGLRVIADEVARAFRA